MVQEVTGAYGMVASTSCYLLAQIFGSLLLRLVHLRYGTEFVLAGPLASAYRGSLQCTAFRPFGVLVLFSTS